MRTLAALWLLTVPATLGALAAVTALALACAFPLVALVALLGVALLTVATHTVSLPITDPED